jgi:uncharacterized SAM-binding protein YcdF (DUF218 family)
MEPGEWRPLLTALALPPVSPLLLAVFGLFVSMRRRALGFFLIFIAVVTLWLVSCNAVAIWLSQNLLLPVQAIPADNAAPALKDQRVQAVVVLGGGVQAQAPEWGAAQPTTLTAQRLHYGAWLARQGNLPLAFAGGVAWANAGQQNPTEADAARRMLEQMQGPALRWVDDSSHDTFGSARVMRPVLQRAGIDRIALVTHAWHMPRSIKAFEQAGFKVISAPMGFIVPVQRPLLEWLPSAHGLQASYLVLREWAGLIVARVQA